MKSDQSSELLEALAELHKRYPEWRFGQLIANVADWADQSVWDVEDQQLLAACRSHLQSKSNPAHQAGV